MKISTKGKYAIKIMLDLATYDNGEPVSVRDIAKRQNISEKYLEQIIGVLNKASLVKSVRGPHGGYVLTDRPEKYTVGKILRVVEGDLSPTDCVGVNGIPCENKSACVSYILWQRLDEAVQEVLESITLQDMQEWQEELQTDYYVI